MTDSFDTHLSALGEIRREVGLLESRALDDSHEYAVARYRIYRRRGLAPRAAYDATAAWVKNTVEQATRRVGHETGAARRMHRQIAGPPW